MDIPVFLNEDVYKQGIRMYETWAPERVPHIAASGATWQGKTYALKLLLAKTCKYVPDVQITVCDFKGDEDFSFLSGCHRFYRFDECIEGLKSFYESFVAIQKNPPKYRPMRILLYDEFAATLAFADKKTAEDLKRMVSSLLMLSRGFNFHIILSQQRLSADSFICGSRDNLNMLLTLGNISKEVAGMLYSDYKDEIIPDRTRGTGYMLINASEFKRIIVPTISNMDKVNQVIKEAVERE